MTISPKAFYETLDAHGVEFITGVPDSLLKEFCAYLADALSPSQHIIAANEGSAVGLAAGHHLATGKVPMVYLQNSGLGNLVNPLLSLADPEVYAIPMVVVIGWRGAPGESDEPQHIKQGRVTESLLSAMEIPYKVVAHDSDLNVAIWAVEAAKQVGGPVVLLVKKGAFGKSELAATKAAGQEMPLTREEAISAVLEAAGDQAAIVSSTGMISREVYEQRRIRGNSGAQDFLTVGSMGHASQIAHGIALSMPKAQVVCIDGDGAALMHLGGLATIGAGPETQLVHVLLNNNAHDSVGGQPTVGFAISFTEIARACGYRKIFGPLVEMADIKETIDAAIRESQLCFVEIRVRKGSRGDLGRPTKTPLQNKQMFIERLRTTK
jgi:phosphonopyruvate decarboxylase